MYGYVLTAPTIPTPISQGGISSELRGNCLGLGGGAILHPFTINSHQQQHIKPTVIVPSGRKCSVLGSNNTLYHIAGRRLCASGRNDLASRFDLTNTKKSRQEFLPPMPNGVSHECLLDGEIDSPPRLAHLAGDDFCLFWGSPCQHYEPGVPLDSVTSRRHCLKFRISKLHPKQGSTFRLDASILSCQSNVVPGVKLFLDSYVGDGHLDLGYNYLEV
ncbi:hypothetical protein CMV_007519 [Castanea mollissima]|uniref:Uncharacterized protein n=1 Tax=Castanea mollissima TaxID=60419 RepID=A0A8J4VQ60_9ROSI|nr:hypothetical protein CMV_007519 [Castanea mollissima]